MTKRLVWNFEINSSSLLNFSLLIASKEEIKWEVRFFWLEEQIICLNGLDDRLLDLGNYEIKERQDNYLVIPDSNYNVKQRRDELQYKPLLQEIDGVCGYGKKIDLTSSSIQDPSIHLIAQACTKATNIAVSKTALIYKLPTTPTIKLELARLNIAGKFYFSACIEGRSQTLVKQIAKHLLPNQISCDYVNFLKQRLNHD